MIQQPEGDQRSQRIEELRARIRQAEQGRTVEREAAGSIARGEVTPPDTSGQLVPATGNPEYDNAPDSSILRALQQEGVTPQDRIPEDELLQRPAWVSAARMIHDQVRLSEPERQQREDFSEQMDRHDTGPMRMTRYLTQNTASPQTEEMSDEEVSEWLLGYVGRTSNNLTELGAFTAMVNGASEEFQTAAFYALSRYENKEVTAGAWGRVLGGLATDPLSYIGLGVVGRVAGQAGKGVSARIGAEAMRNRLLNTATGRVTRAVAGGAGIGAVEGAVYTAGDDALRQSIAMDAEAQEEFDLQRLGNSAMLGLAAGGALGGVLGGVIGGGGEFLAQRLARREASEAPLADRPAPVADSPLPIDEDGYVSFTHDSAVETIVELDPARFGSNERIRGVERGRQGKPGFENRAYVGFNTGLEGGYRGESMTGGNRYRGRVRADRMYDYAADPEGYRARAKEELGDDVDPDIIENRVEQLAKENGWEGYYVQNPDLGLTGAVFNRTPVLRTNRQILLNVGLDMPSGGKVDVGELEDFLTDLSGNLVFNTPVIRSDSEETAVVKLMRPLTDDELDQVASRFGQEAVAQLNGETGSLIGPKAEEWGPFNLDFFYTQNGNRASVEFSYLAQQASLPIIHARPDLPPLEGLPASVNVPGIGKVAVEPVVPARQAAIDYARTSGRDYTQPRVAVKADPERGRRIADAFEEMADAPDDPRVRAAYDAMIEETLEQWKIIKESGIRIEFIDPEGTRPYEASPRLAIEDVRENNHLWVDRTDDAYGQTPITEADIQKNPMLRVVEGETIDGKPVRVNDIFRIVHDYFGHIKEGNGFRATGEENAWRQHAAMYSPVARRAMTTETRGQNSWVNFNRESGEANRTASAEDTIFADQKVGLLPDWVMYEGAEFLDEAAERAALDASDAQFPGGSRLDRNGEERLGTDTTLAEVRKQLDITPERLAEIAQRLQNGDVEGAEGLLDFNSSRIDWDKIGSDLGDDPDKVRNLLNVVSSSLQDIQDEASGGTVVTHKAVSLLAGSIGADPQTIMRLNQDTKNLAARAVAGRRFLLASATRLQQLGKAVTADAPLIEREQAQALYFRQLNLHAALQGMMRNSIREVARAMSSQRMLARPTEGAYASADEVLRNATGMGTKERQQLVEFMDGLDFNGTNSKARRQNHRGLSGIYVEFVRANLLSSLKTVTLNLLGNSIKAGITFPERFVGAGIGLARSAVGLGGQGRITGSQLRGLVVGSVHGLKAPFQMSMSKFTDAMRAGRFADMEDALPSALRAMTRQQQQDGFSARPEFSNENTGHAIHMDGPGLVAKAVNMSGWLLRSVYGLQIGGDQVFKSVALHQSLAEQAYVKGETIANQLGLQGRERSARIKAEAERVLAEPPEEVLQVAMGFADKQTYTDPFQSPLLRKMDDAMKTNPLLQAHIFPFIRTPAKILGDGLGNYMGLNIAMDAAASPLRSTRTRKLPYIGDEESVIGEIMRGGPEGDQALAKLGLGISVMTWAWGAALSGDLTGSRGGWDNSEKQDGIPNYAVRVPGTDQFVTYDRMDPLGIIIGITADTARTYQERAEEMAADPELERPFGELLSSVALSSTRYVTEKSFMSSAAQLMDVATGVSEAAQQSDLDRFVAGVTTSWVPFSSLVRASRQETDPFRREAWGLADRVMNALPGYSERLPIQRDVLGRPMTYPDAVGPDIASYVVEAQRTEDPVLLELSRLSTSLPRPQKDVYSVGEKVTPQQYSDFLRIRGSVVTMGGADMYQALDALMQSEAYAMAPDPGRAKEVKDLMREYSMLARDELRRSDPELDRWVRTRLIRERVAPYDPSRAEELLRQLP